jgi:hypothetical protein
LIYQGHWRERENVQVLKPPHLATIVRKEVGNIIPIREGEIIYVAGRSADTPPFTVWVTFDKPAAASCDTSHREAKTVRADVDIGTSGIDFTRAIFVIVTKPREHK